MRTSSPSSSSSFSSSISWVTLDSPRYPHSDTRTLIDELLAEQQRLTAVERFALLHQRNEIDSSQGLYRDLLPASAPNSGEQYAFSVDLDACSGCKACVTACHNRNGLEDGESWREVGLLHGADESEPFLQSVTTACHHCLDPACLNGCPVLAYDKDPVTGIVRHLDDQCIGCQYCVMKCPYEVPKYSERLGIVRKCDMCAGRLAAGEAPACAQACPNEAISITVVKEADVASTMHDALAAPARLPTAQRRRKSVEGGSRNTPHANPFLPDSPDPRITLPTTRFLSRRPLPLGIRAADHSALRLDSAHWPLVFMLVLTQAAAGMFLIGALLQKGNLRWISLWGLTLLVAGLVASVFHLGQPFKAWRAFLGWRTSWLSREIIALNLFGALATLATLTPWISVLHPYQAPLCTTAAAAGLLAVFASAMVYVDTRRPAWAPRFAFRDFFGTSLLLGASFAPLGLGWSAGQPGPARFAALIAVAIRTALFFRRRLELRVALNNPESPVHFNARVVQVLLPWTATTQTWLFAASILFSLLAVTLAAQPSATCAAVAALTTLISEIISRYVFFAAGASKRMPGGIAA